MNLLFDSLMMLFLVVKVDQIEMFQIVQFQTIDFLNILPAERSTNFWNL